MKKLIKKLRTNENILIAVESLLHSRSAFLDVFLLTFMMGVSIDNSPNSFIIYRMISCVLYAFFAVALIQKLKKHPIACWRLGILAVCLQIIAAVMLKDHQAIYPYVLAILSGIEATLFWRPAMYLSVTEVANNRRLRFESTILIFGSILKITMPVVLGWVIADSGFTDSAMVVLFISLIQFFITILFRPTKPIPKYNSTLRIVWKKYKKSKVLREISLAQARGLFATTSAYLIIPIIIINQLNDSNFDLGLYTSLGALASIVLIIFFNLTRNNTARKVFLGVASLLVIASPLILIWCNQLWAAILYYVISISIAGKLFNVSAVSTLKHCLSGVPDKDKIELETIGEVVLNIYRIITLGILLLLFNYGTTPMLVFASLSAIVAPIIAHLTTTKLKTV